MRNKDDITEAVHGLDIFTKNWCLNCEETFEKKDLTFRCEDCTFNLNADVCAIKKFAYTHKHNYPMQDFGSMGEL